MDTNHYDEYPLELRVRYLEFFTINIKRGNLNFEIIKRIICIQRNDI